MQNGHAASLAVALALACTGGESERRCENSGDCAASADAASGNGDGSAAGGSSGEGICDAGGCTLDSGSGGTGGVAGQCAATDAGESACTPVSVDAEFSPLDIYILFDQSGSMSEDAGGITRMDAVRNALGEFLLQPQSSGMGAGIGYFGYQPIGQASCDPGAYVQADVGIGALPNNAQPIIDSLAGREPTGETPTGAALRGACSYAKVWKQSHATREVVILLVTDGVPQAPNTCADGVGECCPTLEDAAVAASECASSAPGVRVYVLGIGPELQSLFQLAIAGSTQMAYLVAEGDVTMQAVAALEAIRTAALP